MKKIKFDARKLMEQTIEVMRQSIQEPRKDGKASPKVGALLWKPDGAVETACRGELRDGDHAEFTLLERKNRSNKLDGSVLFVTLEPCAPNSRHLPKMSCSERIVLARIKEVYVGIGDPDPTVDRKGIKHLQDAGIIVNMFDRDLQEIIREENSEFLEQALERAAEEEKAEKVTLSSLEEPLEDVDLEELSTGAMGQYCSSAKIDSKVGSSSLNHRLARLGLLQSEGKRFTPTKSGLLLFGKEPRVSLLQAGLLATIHYPDDTEETEDFDGPMVLIPELVEKWLGDKLPNVIDRSAMQRREVPALPFEMVREAVVNALIHRDYDIREAKCQLVVTADTITVKSPGGPLPPITLEQLQAFNAPMLSRNPELHYVFSRMELAEERGLGIKSLRNHAEKAGLPLPRYSWEDPYLDLTLYRDKEAASSTLRPEVLELLSKAEKQGWQWLSIVGRTKSSQYAQAVGIDARTARRHLNRFGVLGLVEKRGAGPSTEYEVI